MRRMGIVACVALAACGPRAWGAGEIVLTSSRDNTLYEDLSGQASNGAGEFFFTGVTAEPGLRRGLLEFDLSALPDGATVVGCELTLHMSKTIVGETPVSLHRALAFWGEGASDAEGSEGFGAPAAPGDATWVHTEYDTYYWSSLGGEYDTQPVATTPVDREGEYRWASAAMTALVADWASGATPNYGWVLVGDESGDITAKRFDTRENAFEGFRPRLRVVYRPACTADWNSDGAVNTIDFIAYLNEWVAGSPAADLNGDALVNTQDFLVFLNAWSAGC